MLQHKLLTTVIWASVSIAAAMLADFVITIAILRDFTAYTPLVTFSIASVVSFPTTYALVSSRVNLQKARDELAITRDAAINANLSRTLFFTNMAHELRTPLNAIIGFSEMLGSDTFVNKRVEYAKLIHGSGTHLLTLVNDLLDVSRIEAGKLQLHFETVDFAELAEECLRTVEPRARGARLRLVRRFDRAVPPVMCDRRAVKQILLNLLTNAIKFTGPGGVVELFGSVIADGQFAFGVSDNGAGIAPEDQARVFERFGQAQQTKTVVEEGTGLGLPIVKGLVEAHGGTVTLDSAVGRGTCVTALFPASRVEAPFPVALAS
ncbi:MAG TPA: HAMP domain-containing sensor histidine kinase [Rhizomicrobium sp.]|jgi:signal transduction histidine kinase|nr:HAMP domain-containing sensor histidine kinase [Rhizomicrobium sp.]